MDPAILQLNYNDLLKHAKDLGLSFADRKPKKDKIIDKITAYHQHPSEKIKKPRKARKIDQYTEVPDNDDETIKKKTKKVIKKMDANKSNKVAQADQLCDDLKPKNIKKETTKTSKKGSVEIQVEKESTENEKQPIKVVKKVKKIKTVLKNNETEEMKRIRRSILEKKIVKMNKSTAESTPVDELEKKVSAVKKMTRKASKAKLQNQDIPEEIINEKVKEKKVKKIAFSEDSAANVSGDVSRQMRRRILNKKKKSSSPILKPTTARCLKHSKLVDGNFQRTELVETNKIIESEEINDEQFQLKLDNEDSNEPTENELKKETQPRRSSSVGIQDLTPVIRIASARKSLTTTPPKRKSIAFISDKNTSATAADIDTRPFTTTPSTNRRSVHFSTGLTNTPSRIAQFTATPVNNRQSVAFTIDAGYSASYGTNYQSKSSTMTPLNNRKSIAFTIENTPNKLSQASQIKQGKTALGSRKSIETVSKAELRQSMATNISVLTDDDSIDRTYEKPESTSNVPGIEITSPVVPCASFYKLNNMTVVLDDQKTGHQLESDIISEQVIQFESVVQPKPVARARIVRPKQVETTIEPMLKHHKNDPTEIVMKKVVEIVKREAGPRIVKPTQPSPKVLEINKKRVLNNGVKPKPVVKKPESIIKPTTPKSMVKKVPDFRAIHNKKFSKGEDVTEAAQRLQQRHTQLTGAKSVVSTASSSDANSVGMVSNLMSHASNILKKITPFSQNIDENITPKIEKIKPPIFAKDTQIVKAKLITEKENKLRNRTPLGTRTYNTLRTPGKPNTPTAKTPLVTDKNTKTPVSIKKPRPFSVLNSSKKPQLTKPFHFQNQNLESNINFGGACQFGSNTGKTPLKDSAFNRRKSYNPRESIGRPLSYNPHIGKLKPLEPKSQTDGANLNESVSVKTASIAGANEKRKSIFGIQRNLEKEKLNVKRKVLRNNEMDKPRVLYN